MVDRTTGDGISNASVLLLNEAGVIQKMTVSDPAAAYSVVAPAPGTYTFRVDAPGYNTHNEPPFSVLAGRILELEIRVWSLTELAPVVVTAEAQPFAPGPLEGFYERKRLGRGEFVTREEIEQRGAVRFTDILRAVRSISVVPLAGGSGYTVRLKGTTLARDCPPMLWVDNVRWGAADADGGPDRALFPSDVEGVEVYRPSAVPLEFASGDTSCGAVVVWTRRSP